MTGNLSAAVSGSCPPQGKAGLSQTGSKPPMEGHLYTHSQTLALLRSLWNSSPGSCLSWSCRLRGSKALADLERGISNTLHINTQSQPVGGPLASPWPGRHGGITKEQHRHYRMINACSSPSLAVFWPLPGPVWHKDHISGGGTAVTWQCEQPKHITFPFLPPHPAQL